MHAVTILDGFLPKEKHMWYGGGVLYEVMKTPLALEFTPETNKNGWLNY